MIPVLYEKDELSFANNGICRLRDCISCIVTEERNGIYECDFEYPTSGANYDLIKVGRIIGVTHDDTNDLQPFDIVSYTRPIDGIVSFHAVHVSYRLSYVTVTGSNINSLADAFTLLATGVPSNPFSFWRGFTSNGYMAAADGTPRTVRQMLGGIEGSVLETYGGEYAWDKFTVKLYQNRGVLRDFSIRYGVNLLDYNEEYDITGIYSSCIPYWTDGTTTVVGDRQDYGTQTITGRSECIPLDVSEKFENQPTKAQVESAGLSYMKSNKSVIPAQHIEVEFANISDMGVIDSYENIMQCRLCDTIKVIFPDFNSSGKFKIVKTEWNVLTDKYEKMELGELSVSLSEALGISENLEKTPTIPTKTSELTNDSGYLINSDFIKEDVLLADNITISGQTYGNGNASVSKTGYTPLGIVGMHLQNASTGGQNNTTCAMHSWYLSGSTAYWIVRGTSTSTAKIKVTATILYVAT